MEDAYLTRKINQQAASKILKQQKMDRLILDNKNLSLENQELRFRLRGIVKVVNGEYSAKKKNTMSEISKKVNEYIGGQDE